MPIDERQAKKICLFGPQGSGKGTQAEKISAEFGVPQIAPGNIFRKAVADKTELGKQVEAIINSGKLVPDEVTNQLMKERIAQEDCLDGFVLDGYPRNQVQADALDTMSSLTHVVVIDLSDDAAIDRIAQRRACPNCGMTYHMVTKKPKKEGICDSCGTALVQRNDDKPEATRKRLDIYRTQTEPLVARFEKRGIVCRVDGAGSIDDVWKHIQNCFY